MKRLIHVALVFVLFVASGLNHETESRPFGTHDDPFLKNWVEWVESECGLDVLMGDARDYPVSEGDPPRVMRLSNYDIRRSMMDHIESPGRVSAIGAAFRADGGEGKFAAAESEFLTHWGKGSIFLAFSHKDSAAAMRLANRLVARGHVVFTYVHGVHETPWATLDFVYQRIADAEHVLALDTVSSRKSMNVFVEAIRRRYHEKSGSQSRRPSTFEPYQARPNDTVNGLAHRFGIRPSEIVAANDIPNPDLIIAGRTYLIPTFDNYFTLRPEHTLTGVAVVFGVSVEELRRANPWLETVDHRDREYHLLLPDNASWYNWLALVTDDAPESEKIEAERLLEQGERPSRLREGGRRRQSGRRIRFVDEVLSGSVKNTDQRLKRSKKWKATYEDASKRAKSRKR